MIELLMLASGAFLTICFNKIRQVIKGEMVTCESCNKEFNKETCTSHDSIWKNSWPSDSPGIFWLCNSCELERVINSNPDNTRYRGLPFGMYRRYELSKEVTDETIEEVKKLKENK